MANIHTFSSCLGEAGGSGDLRGAGGDASGVPEPRLKVLPCSPALADLHGDGEYKVSFHPAVGRLGGVQGGRRPGPQRNSAEHRGKARSVFSFFRGCPSVSCCRLQKAKQKKIRGISPRISRLVL